MQPELHDRFTLDLELGSEPIAGSLTDERGTSTPFYGWLALARLLERARIRSGVARLDSPLNQGRTEALNSTPDSTYSTDGSQKHGCR
jgi:hypothetical protein